MLDGAAIKRPYDVAAQADHGQKQGTSGRINGGSLTQGPITEADISERGERAVVYLTRATPESPLDHVSACIGHVARTLHVTDANGANLRNSTDSAGKTGTGAPPAPKSSGSGCF